MLKRSRICLCLLLGILATPLRAAELVLEEVSSVDVCDFCRPLALAWFDGGPIIYATPESDTGELRAYRDDGSFVLIGPDSDLRGFSDADGRYIAASFFGLEGAFRLDYLNPTELFTESNPQFFSNARVMGVNASGDFAGSFEGIAANTYTSETDGAVFLPGPLSNEGAARDINNAGTVVVGTSSDNSQFDVLPTVWLVDSALGVESSFIIGESEGIARFVGDTVFDSEYTVLFGVGFIAESSAYYFGSTGETGNFGDSELGVPIEILTATTSQFLLRDQSSLLCSAAIPDGNKIELGTNCGGAVEENGRLHVLFGTGVVKTYFVTLTGLADVALVSSALPTSRSVRLGNTATAFATIINAGTADAQACSLTLADPQLDADFFYQMTNSATNVPLGESDTPVDIPAGQAQSFVFGIRPNAELPPTEISLRYRCDNSGPASSVVGLNTLLLSATDGVVADVIALAATVSNDGIVRVNPTTGAGAFSVASANVGDSASLQVTADTGSAMLPVQLSLCETHPTTGVCINPVSPTTDPVIVTIGANETPTFSVFVVSEENISLDPANGRVFVRFRDGAGMSRGATSVAVTTE